MGCHIPDLNGYRIEDARAARHSMAQNHKGLIRLGSTRLSCSQQPAGDVAQNRLAGTVPQEQKNSASKGERTNLGSARADAAIHPALEMLPPGPTGRQPKGEGALGDRHLSQIGPRKTKHLQRLLWPPRIFSLTKSPSASLLAGPRQSGNE